jgi:hypothetical protein
MSIVKQAKQFRDQEEADRKRRGEQRRRGLDAERRRKLAETNQER